MSAPLSTTTHVSLPPAIDRVTSQRGGDLTAWGLPVICGVISMLATALFVERHRQEAWRAAEYELAAVAAIAAEDFLSASARVAKSNDGDELRGAQPLSGIGNRIRRLTGKQAVFFDPRDKVLVPPVDPMLESIVRPDLESIAGAVPESMFNLPGTGDARSMMVYTQRLPSVLAAPRMVAVLAPESEIMARFNALRRNALTACVGFMLIVLTLAWAFSRHLVRRDVFEAAMLEREHALKAQRTQLNETYRIAQIGNFYWDLATDALELQGDDNSIYGDTPSQYFRTMREWQENFCPPDDLEGAAASRNRFKELGEPYKVHRRAYTPAGELRWLEVSAEPVLDANGKAIAFRGAFRDITAEKTAQLRLKESEEKFRLISENMRDLITLHTADGTLLYVSPSFRAITGHDLWAIVGFSAHHLLHPDDSLWVQKRYVQLIAGKGVMPQLTYRLRHHDGHYLWLESHITLVRAADGSLFHLQIASRDVTARREAEIAVEKKSIDLATTNKLLEVEVRERQALERNILMTIEMELAQVGLELHDELGQDLTGIALLSKSLERRLAEKGWGDAAEAARISELVNRTIRHTRMISHGLSPYIWGTDGLVAALSQLAGDISSLGVMECETMLDTSISIHDEIVARSLYRIAQESINNAMKHSRAQRLTLSLTDLESGVELTISDDGVGYAGMTGQLETGGRFHSIRHRCSAINAVLTVRHRKRGGTVVKVVWHQPASIPAPESHSAQARQ